MTRRPELNEFAPHAQAYFKLVPEGDLVELLARQMEATAAMLQTVDEERATTFSYAPGKWTIKDILEHISDTERILAYRVLRLSRGDKTELPGFEQDDYARAANAGRQNLANLIEEFKSVRRATLSLFAGLSEESWMQTGVVSGFNVTARALAYTLAGHELHHVKILRERYINS